MEIREMKTEELDAVLQLNLEGLENEINLLNQILPGKKIDKNGTPQLKKVIYQMLHLGECNIFVAKEGDFYAGYCLVTKRNYPVEDPKTCGCINGIFIRPEARKQKLGTRLFDLALAWLKTEHVKYLELYHMINDERAAAFWRKMGFTPVQYNCARLI